MFRTPQMKNSVNQLRFHRLLLLTLRDTVRERTGSLFRGGCMRGDGIHWWRRHNDVVCKTALMSVHNFSSVSSTFSVVLDTFKRVPPQKTILICLSTQFLLTDIHFSSVSRVVTPNAFMHSSSLAPRPALDRSKCLLPVKKQTCCYIMKRKTESKGNITRMSNIGTVLSKGCFETAAHTVQPAVQTRGLHRNAQQWALWDECLSAGNEVRCKQSLRLNAALYEWQEKSWAAVLVCLCLVGRQPALLFTLRSAKLKGRHKGDVSFAGGKKDSSDRTVVDTALREAREELGIHITEDKVWGVLKPMRDQSGMMIAPVIANLGPLEVLSFQPNPSEVDEIFTLTLEHLCLPQNRGYTHFRTGDHYSYTLPVFHSPKYRVWGLTAVALNHTLKLILPPKQLLDHSLSSSTF